MKPPKYRNRKTVVDGVTFDSAKEAKRWGELILLDRTGVIANLKRQVRIPLKVNGHLVCTFVADFTYDENGSEVVEDVKSPFTRKLPVYRIKYKLLKALTGVVIRET